MYTGCACDVGWFLEASLTAFSYSYSKIFENKAMKNFKQWREQRHLIDIIDSKIKKKLFVFNWFNNWQIYLKSTFLRRIFEYILKNFYSILLVTVLILSFFKMAARKLYGREKNLNLSVCLKCFWPSLPTVSLGCKWKSRLIDHL